MTDRLGVLADVKFVLGVLPWDTRHVLGGPCEDIPILTEEVDELAFLFVVEAGAYDNVLAAARVFWVELHFLGLLGGLEGGLVGRLRGRDRRSRGLACQGDDPVELAPLLGNDQRLGQLCAVSGALQGLAVIAGDGDEALGTRHLHLQIRVMGNRHELGERGPAQQCVVCAGQVHHLEPDRFASEVAAVTEQDI